jgi:hypothetical protein
MGPMSAGPRPPNAEPVARERALDPRTGLPVVRYVGPYAPTLRPGAPAPAGAWRLLACTEREGRWFVEAEMAAAARPLAEVAATVDDDDVAELLDVLDDAARLGVAHGGLTVERLWRHGPSVRVEGYGVGWGPHASVEADRAAVAGALLDLPGTAITAPVRTQLAQLAGRGAGATTIAPAATGAGTGAAAGAAADAAADAASHAAPGPVPQRPASDASAPTTPARHPAEADTGADAPAPRTAATFVKGPPPGATVRTGDTPTARLHARAVDAVARAQASVDGRRRLLLGGLLVSAVVVFASLSVGLQRRPQAAASAAGTAVAYVVDVRVEPPGLPPARLVVLESPPGSRLEVGTVIGSVPRKVPLDRAGTWRFEARFLDRRSAPATLVLPRDHVLVLVFPEPTAAP